jgi:hypothetical protein
MVVMALVHRLNDVETTGRKNVEYKMILSGAGRDKTMTYSQ